MGAYDGCILRERIDEICKGNLRDKTSFWKSDVLKTNKMKSQSLIKNANRANFRNVKGLNKGRMLLLHQTLNADINDEIMIEFYKNKLVEYREDIVRKFFNGITDLLKEENPNGSLWSIFDSLEESYYKQILKLGKDIRKTVEEIKTEESDHNIIELYQCFTDIKVVTASILMSYYWLHKKTELELDNIDYRNAFFDLKKKIRELNLSEADINLSTFNKVIQHVIKFLEEYFGKEGRESTIFSIVYRDYMEDDRLYKICNSLAGIDTNDQIPSSLPNANLPYVWTEISNDFWTGVSPTAQSYFNDFVSKIYKCCGETHSFLINEVTERIKNLLDSNLGEIVYKDFASGKKGTIIVGVYERLEGELSKEKFERISFEASDSSSLIVSDLEACVKGKGYRIRVTKRNLANLLKGERENTINVITQNLGGHHLPKSHLVDMYNSFFELLKDGGYLAIGDVMVQPIKILAGLPDDIGAPEYPYDVRNLDGLINDRYLMALVRENSSGMYPPLGANNGFYTTQVYKKNSARIGEKIKERLDEKFIDKRDKSKLYKILFLGCNSSDAPTLQQSRESDQIERLHRYKDIIDFDLRKKWEITVQKIDEELNFFKPNVIHLSGHGDKEYFYIQDL